MQTIIEAMPLASMLLFFAIFLIMLFYVFTDRRRSHREHMASMALDDETQRGERS